MTSDPISSEILGDLFGTADMRALFDDDARLQKMLDVEAALARAQARIGMIPEAAAVEISDKARSSIIDRPDLARRTKLAGAPVAGLVAQLGQACDGDAGRYVHWGATTQDIVDTGLVLQMRGGLEILNRETDAVCAALKTLAENHRGSVMAGRTYLQHALPVSFGYKAAIWLAGLLDARTSLNQAAERALSLQFGGAVGNLASLGAQGFDVAEALGRELDLNVPEINWHVRRGNLAQFGSAVSLLCAALGKIATDICLMSQTEIAELAEPHQPGRGGSSTMPQKRNPVSSMLILAIARQAQAQSSVLQSAMLQDHERPIDSWQAEWAAMPQLFVLSSGALAHARFVLEGLHVDTARMRANLDLTGGLIMAEAVMMALSPEFGHAKAHDLVEELCSQARAKGQSLKQAMVAHAEIGKLLNDKQIDALLDPANYIGRSDALVGRVLNRALQEGALS